MYVLFLLVFIYFVLTWCWFWKAVLVKIREIVTILWLDIFRLQCSFYQVKNSVFLILFSPQYPSCSRMFIKISSARLNVLTSVPILEWCMGNSAMVSFIHMVKKIKQPPLPKLQWIGCFHWPQFWPNSTFSICMCKLFHIQNIIWLSVLTSQLNNRHCSHPTYLTVGLSAVFIWQAEVLSSISSVH